MGKEKGIFTYQEIMSQGATWERIIQFVDKMPSSLKDWIKEKHLQTIFTGCGSAYYLSISASIIWQTLTGRIARPVHASEIWFHPEVYLTKDIPMLVATSRSGETTETIRAMETYINKTGKEPLAITCSPELEIGSLTNRILDASDANEKGVAQTRSITSMYILTQIAACIAAEKPELIKKIRQIPSFFQPMINEYHPLAKEIASRTELDHIVFLGTGINYGLACEAHLKMKEISLSHAEAYPFMEFRHGPKSIITKNSLVVGLVSDQTRDAELKVLEEMKELGATVLELADSADDFIPDYRIHLNANLDDITRGPLYMPVLQLLAYHRAIMKGLDPDQPAHVDTVVKLD
jgi:glucosamine--fructose-6-phosphate aminotransferase (isomerizing)